MSENLKKFIEIVSNDVELAKKLTTTNEEEISEKIKLAISIAKEKGIELVEKDFLGMTDNDLKAAAGGYESPNMQQMNDGRDMGFFIVSPFVVANVNTETVANVFVAPSVSPNANVIANTTINVNMYA